MSRKVAEASPTRWRLFDVPAATSHGQATHVLDRRGPDARWQTSAEVRHALGPDGLRELDGFEATVTMHCQVCGGEVPPTSHESMSVLAAVDGPAVAILFAHARCSESQIVEIDLGAAAEASADATAWFAERRQFPSAVLAFESHTRLSLPGQLDWPSLVKAVFTAYGFAVVTDDIAVASPPVVHGWRLSTAGGVLELGPPGGPVAYVQEMTPEAQRWVLAAKRDGCCIVVTAGALGLAAWPGPEMALAKAVRGRLLVGATVTLDS